MLDKANNFIRNKKFTLIFRVCLKIIEIFILIDFCLPQP